MPRGEHGDIVCNFGMGGAVGGTMPIRAVLKSNVPGELFMNGGCSVHGCIATLDAVQHGIIRNAPGYHTTWLEENEHGEIIYCILPASYGRRLMQQGDEVTVLRTMRLSQLQHLLRCPEDAERYITAFFGKTAGIDALAPHGETTEAEAGMSKITLQGAFAIMQLPSLKALHEHFKAEITTTSREAGRRYVFYFGAVAAVVAVSYLCLRECYNRSGTTRVLLYMAKMEHE